jgi:hypothetical protein
MREVVDAWVSWAAWASFSYDCKGIFDASILSLPYYSCLHKRILYTGSVRHNYRVTTHLHGLSASLIQSYYAFTQLMGLSTKSAAPLASSQSHTHILDVQKLCDPVPMVSKCVHILDKKWGCASAEGIEQRYVRREQELMLHEWRKALMCVPQLPSLFSFKNGVNDFAR